MAKLKKIWPVKLNKWLCLAIAAVIVVSACSVGVAYARYVRGDSKNVSVKSPEFYFTSDLLSETGANYSLNYGTTSISIVLKNHADNLRWSEDDVNYTIELKEEGSDTFIAFLSGTIANTASNSVTIDFTNKLENGKKYVVTAIGTAGYKQTQTATFEVQAHAPEIYMHSEGTLSSTMPYVLLTVWTKNYSTSNVVIDFPAGLIPDNTWPGMSAVYSVDGKFTVGLGAYSSNTYRFFKDVGYSGGAITVTADGNVVAESYPD